MSASAAIKQRLSELNMTQTELATAIGTTRQNLANKMSRDNFSAQELCYWCCIRGKTCFAR